MRINDAGTWGYYFLLYHYINLAQLESIHNFCVSSNLDIFSFNSLCRELSIVYVLGNESLNSDSQLFLKYHQNEQLQKRQNRP